MSFVRFIITENTNMMVPYLEQFIGRLKYDTHRFGNALLEVTFKDDSYDFLLVSGSNLPSGLDIIDHSLYYEQLGRRMLNELYAANVDHHIFRE